jgi:ABC-type nickel/cobalt efflux system permease component RcnA
LAPTLLLILTALSLGFLHALEVDHMLAVTTFVAGRPALRTAAVFGLRWGLGHSVAVMALGGGLLATGLRWPAGYDAIGEGLVGLMLVGLGCWALRASRNLHLHPPAEHGDHAHLHVHADGATHAHPHAPSAGAEHHHHHAAGHGITLVGLMHGLAGSGGVVAILPVTFLGSVGLGLAYLAAFGVGVTVGMILYAAVAALAMQRAASHSVAWGRRLMGMVGVAGVVVGGWWILRVAGAS